MCRYADEINLMNCLSGMVGWSFARQNWTWIFWRNGSNLVQSLVLRTLNWRIADSKTCLRTSNVKDDFWMKKFHLNTSEYVNYPLCFPAYFPNLPILFYRLISFPWNQLLTLKTLKQCHSTRTNPIQTRSFGVVLLILRHRQESHLTKLSLTIRAYPRRRLTKRRQCSQEDLICWFRQKSL